jgi:PIN domain nuclease of toxin-antitoxin system
MKYLLDTHVLIYLGCEETEEIGKRALEVYKNPDTQLFVSQISYWEMAIKMNIGKLHIPIGLQNIIVLSRQVGIETISVKNSHILYYQSLEVQQKHKDPFDRYIISTAASENLILLSSDTKFDLYPMIQRIWD